MNDHLLYTNFGNQRRIEAYLCI